MCFFDQHVYECGDWKWGTFRGHCSKEYRTGETCGMKLVNIAIAEEGWCKICKAIETQQRKIKKEEDNIARWQKERGRRHSIEAAQDKIREYQAKIHDLWCQKAAKQSHLG